MLDPNNPVTGHVTQGIMNMLGGQPQPQQGWRQDYHNALSGWHDQRPTFDPATMQQDAFRQQIQQWQSQRPGKADFRGAIGAPIQGNPGMQGQPVPNALFPLNPNPGVGSSYAVQGMTPATSQYGLPTY